MQTSNVKRKNIRNLIIALGLFFLLVAICSDKHTPSSNTNRVSTATTQKQPSAADLRSMRSAYVTVLQNNFYDRNLNITVVATGAQKDTLYLTYILFNNVWVHHFQKGALLQEIWDLKFKKVILRQGNYDGALYWTLTR